MTLEQAGGEGAGTTAEYVVVGHCCESSDLLTPKSGAASDIDTRVLNKAEIGECDNIRLFFWREGGGGLEITTSRF